MKKEKPSNFTDLQYKVTKENYTEPPFKNEYWDNHQEGLYVDINDGTALFLSINKYDSGSGWPSFTQPINKSDIVELKDTSHYMERIEVRSRKSDSHLGHVFSDGPKDKGGLRYCINSASLKFIPVDQLEENGYKDFLKYFINI